MDTKKPHVKVNLVYFLEIGTQHNWKDLRRHCVKRNIYTLHLDLLHLLHSQLHLEVTFANQRRTPSIQSGGQDRSWLGAPTRGPHLISSHLISSRTSLQHNFSTNVRLRQFHGNFSKISASQAFAPGVIPSFEAFTTMMMIRTDSLCLSLSLSLCGNKRKNWQT